MIGYRYTEHAPPVHPHVFIPSSDGRLKFWGTTSLYRSNQTSSDLQVVSNSPGSYIQAVAYIFQQSTSLGYHLKPHFYAQHINNMSTDLLGACPGVLLCPGCWWVRLCSWIARKPSQRWDREEWRGYPCIRFHWSSHLWSCQHALGFWHYFRRRACHLRGECHGTQIALIFIIIFL